MAAVAAPVGLGATRVATVTTAGDLEVEEAAAAQ